jgi:transposase-like protein
MLSDKPARKEMAGSRNRSINANTNKRWSDEQKTEAVKTYLLLGNMALTSRLLAIPEITLKVWKRSEWWSELVREFKSQERMELTTRTKKIVNAALTVVEDRLVHGDFQFDQKTGEVVRKPVNMKDAHKVAVDLQERADKLEAMEEGTYQPEEQKTEDKLLKLAEKFAEMATKKIEQRQLEERTVDAETVEVKL